MGTPVLVHRLKRSAKWKRRWEGPYIVARRSAGGAYLLARPDGSSFLARRFPAHLLKRWRGPLAGALGEDLAEFIIRDRAVDGRREYLVHWHGFSAAQRTWEPSSSFPDTDTLFEYHRSSARPYPLFD